MRLNSTSPSKILKFVYLICIFAVAFDIIILNIDGSWGSFTKLSPFALLLILFVIYRGLPQFVYDSDGEVLNFTTKEPNLDFLGRKFIKHLEFPKRKLIGYKVIRLPFRRILCLYIKSKDKGYKRRVLTISYLRRSEVRDLRKSLDRVMVTNRKLKNGRE